VSGGHSQEFDKCENEVKEQELSLCLWYAVSNIADNSRVTVAGLIKAVSFLFCI
jgi:hypothetical protein